MLSADSLLPVTVSCGVSAARAQQCILAAYFMLLITLSNFRRQVLWLFTAAQLLVKLKRLELRQRLAKQKEEEKAFQTPKKAKEPGEAAENKKER
jgi:hypothetical protein